MERRRRGGAGRTGAFVAAPLWLATGAGPSPAAASAPVPCGGDLDAVRASGVLRHLGVPFARFVSGEGEGFDVFLPRDVAEPILQAPGQEERPERVAGGEVVLVVEDEEQVRSLVVAQLTARGYAVLSAADGREALRIAETRAERIDVLLADVVMPRMSGPELARRLQRTHPGTAVIFMSGYAEEAVLARGTLGAGGDFIGKPFAVDDLAARIRQILGRRGRSRAGMPGEGSTCDFRHPG